MQTYSNKMYRISKKDLKKVGDIYPDLVQLQVEDYCPESYRVVITNPREFIEKDNEE